MVRAANDQTGSCQNQLLSDASASCQSGPVLKPDYEVLIIGTGFAGLGLAIQMKAAGFHDFTVLEKEAGIYPMPRAIHFDGEVMRILRRAHRTVVGRFHAGSEPYVVPFDIRIDNDSDDNSPGEIGFSSAIYDATIAGGPRLTPSRYRRQDSLPDGRIVPYRSARLPGATGVKRPPRRAVNRGPIPIRPAGEGHTMTRGHRTCGVSCEHAPAACVNVPAPDRPSPPIGFDRAADFALRVVI